MSWHGPPYPISHDQWPAGLEPFRALQTGKINNSYIYSKFPPSPFLSHWNIDINMELAIPEHSSISATYVVPNKLLSVTTLGINKHFVYKYPQEHKKNWLPSLNSCTLFYRHCLAEGYDNRFAFWISPSRHH